MAATYKDVEHEGYRYRQKDVVRTPEQTGMWRFAGVRKPLRETTFKARNRHAPAIHPVESQSPHQLKSPIVVRRLTEHERRDRRRQNLAVGVTTGALVGSGAKGIYRMAAGAPKGTTDQGLIQQLKNKRKPISWKEVGRSYKGSAGRSAAFIGGGALAGGTLAAARNLRMKRRTEYGSAYSTEGMKPLRESRR